MNELNLQNPEFLEIIIAINIDENRICIEVSSSGIWSTTLMSLNNVFDPVQYWINDERDDITTFKELENHIPNRGTGL